MRTMMMDGGVHNDVVNKLWQVYGTFLLENFMFVHMGKFDEAQVLTRRYRNLSGKGQSLSLECWD